MYYIIRNLLIFTSNIYWDQLHPLYNNTYRISTLTNTEGYLLHLRTNEGDVCLPSPKFYFDEDTSMSLLKGTRNVSLTHVRALTTNKANFFNVII